MNDVVRQQALQWLVQVRDAPADAVVQQAFDRWLSAHDGHRLAYLDALMVFNAAAEATVPKPVAVPASFARRHAGWLGAVLGAAAALALLLGPRWSEHWRADEIAPPGVHREITLADGTQLRLAPDAAVALDIDATRRDITLLRGSVMVDVAADPRPLALHYRDSTVRDIGTRFEVQAAADVLRVGVAEGLVEVRRGEAAAVRVAAGEQVTWQGTSSARHAWREYAIEPGMLVLDRAPAPLAIAQWAAYSGRRVRWIGHVDAGSHLDAVLPMRTPAEQRAALATLARQFDLSVILDVEGFLLVRANG